MIKKWKDGTYRVGRRIVIKCKLLFGDIDVWVYKTSGRLVVKPKDD